jgi:PBP1b-binding outer membrane lipoprotein LpoB
MNKIQRAKLVWTTYTAMIITIMLLALFMQGCASAGYQNVDTSRKAILVATAEVRGANLLLQDLIEREAISNDDAKNALNQLIIAKDQLQTALNAIDLAGDPATATTNLQRANLAISVALNLLAPLLE